MPNTDWGKLCLIEVKRKNMRKEKERFIIMRKGEGPSIEFARRYVSKTLIFITFKKFIDTVLKKHIPGSTCEIYGTWGGFDISGLNYVRREIKKYRNALFVLRRKTCTNMGRKSV